MTSVTMKLPALSSIYKSYESYCRLAQESFSGALAGKLVMRSGLDTEGLAESVAAGIAGACSLCVEPEGEKLREALRAGLFDFVVSPLDEALRILKNELRRGRSIAVGVTADPEPTLAESINRGLQPDIVSLPAGEPRRTFVERGAVLLPEPEAPRPDSVLMEWTIAADAVRVLPQIARIAMESLDAKRTDTPARWQWLEKVPRHLGRTFAAHHCVRMTPAEASVFGDAARAQFPTVQIEGDSSAF